MDEVLRKLCRQRFFIVDMASDLKRKIIALLNQTFPEYEKLFSDIFGKSSVELFANYTTSEEMLSVDTQTLAAPLSKTSRGRLGLDKANQIQQFAKNSFGTSCLPRQVSLSSSDNIRSNSNHLNRQPPLSMTLT